MIPFLRMVHLLALGLWFGSTVFFSFFVALPLITHMQDLAERRPAWLPGLTERDQGTRLAGEGLNVLFARYFPVQVACGVCALATGVLLARPGRLERVRLGLLALALALAAVNLLYLGQRVSELRSSRYVDDPAAREQNRSRFSTWHGYSLGADLAGLACVTLALGLLGWMPSREAASR